MISINKIIKLIAALYLAKYIGDQILLNKYDLVVALLVGFVYLLFFSLDKKFILFSIAAFFPFMLKGKLGPIFKPTLIEITSLILCFLLILENASKKQSFFSKKAFIFFAAIGVIFLWTVLSYVKHPVTGRFLSGGEGGLRAYMTIFIGITIFLCSFWFFRYRELNVKRWLILILIVSLVLGYLQIIGFFAGFHIPFLGGNFRFQLSIINSPFTGYTYWRVGGLDEMAILGFTALFALYHKKKRDFFYFLIFMNSFIFLYFSAGRTALVASTFVIFVYFALINKRYFFRFIASLLISGGILIIFLPNIQLGGQMERILGFKGGIERQAKYRHAIYQLQWDTFKENPIFGKGIKRVDIGAEGTLGKFVEAEYIKGGHGSYLSMLSLFGIGGAFFIIVMLYGSMYYAYRIFKRSLEFQDDARLALFAFLFLLSLSVFYISWGKGYDSMQLWFLSGMIAGIKAKEEV